MSTPTRKWVQAIADSAKMKRLAVLPNVRQQLENHVEMDWYAGAQWAAKHARDAGYTELAELCESDPQAALVAVELQLEDA